MLRFKKLFSLEKNPLSLFAGLASVAVVLFQLFIAPPVSLADPPDWDRSTLQFQGSCSGDCAQIQAQVCNNGSAMAGPVTYEVWFAPTGNPKDGTKVAEGTLGPLGAGQCTTLSYTPTSSGNYMFKAYQRPGHPGTGELWSEQCSLQCQVQPSPSPSPSPSPEVSPSPSPEASPSPSPSPQVSPSPSPEASPLPSPSPEVSPSPSPEPSPSPSPEASPSPSPVASPSPSPSPAASPSPSPAASPSPSPAAPASPSPAPPASPSPSPAVGGTSNPVTQGIISASPQPEVLGEQTQNPVVEGIKSVGQVLGATTLPQTGEGETDEAFLPSGNKVKEDVSLFIPKIGLREPLYEGQMAGNALLIGHQEILETPLNGGKLIYAHNTTADFGEIHELRNGDTVIRIDKGITTVYQVNSVMRVSQSYSPVFEQIDPNEIMLVTCDLGDPSLRVIIQANPIQ